jgi:7,8-dihydroneopterin aldolase/epimerase/oxygenase
MNFYAIHVEDVALNIRMGIHDFERAAPQPLLVNACLILPVPAQARDDIAAVVDYDYVRSGIMTLASLRHYDLQESFCTALIDHMMSNAHVLGAVVRSRKTSVYADARAVGCTMARFADGFDGTTVPAWLVRL